MSSVERPLTVFDDGLQHERTALAWERTAISIMVAGIAFARYAATDAHPVLAVAGIVEVAFGGGLLLWSARHYDDLHGQLRNGDSVVHPTAARIVGLTTVAFSAVCLLLAILLTF